MPRPQAAPGQNPLTTPRPATYPPIADYALISDCHSMALVSSTGSIDWCCMPRVDSASVFGRLLDWKAGGYCSIAPGAADFSSFRRYREYTMVLETSFVSPGGEVRLIDCFCMHEGGSQQPYNQLVRIVEGVRGRVELEMHICPRFDYGEVRPWLRFEADRLYAAIGGDDGLLISSDIDMQAVDHHDLAAQFTVRPDERVRLSIRYLRPEHIDRGFETVGAADIDQRLQQTTEWWERWCADARLQGPDAPGAVRSALVLKALSNAPTGAIAAAATTSLPESIGADRNWDYRFSWIRDSSLSARSLTEIGLESEADGFRRFIQRSAAGSAEELQIMYGVGGERRLTEVVLDHLEGYRGSRPVRVGNAASRQLQLDAYGTLLDLSWRWHRRGHSPDDDYWRFLVDLVDTAAERWSEPDRGIWEIRGQPQHFVHSKVLCWAALDCGLKLARECMRKAPERRWEKVRREIREAVDAKGFDKRRNTFVQAFGGDNLDGALLLLPSVGYLAYDDPRMVGTVDAILNELQEGGLILRYRTDRTDDGLKGKEGHFLACTFWMAEALARQGRSDVAREVFDRAAATGNDLGLFSEEYDLLGSEMLGNFPQALTHLSHIAASVALAETRGEVLPPRP